MKEAIPSTSDWRQSGLILCNIAPDTVDCVSLSSPIVSPQEYIQRTIAGVITVEYGTPPYELACNDQLLCHLDPL